MKTVNHSHHRNTAGFGLFRPSRASLNLTAWGLLVTGIMLAMTTQAHAAWLLLMTGVIGVGGVILILDPRPTGSASIRLMATLSVLPFMLLPTWTGLPIAAAATAAALLFAIGAVRPQSSQSNAFQLRVPAPALNPYPHNNPGAGRAPLAEHDLPPQVVYAVGPLSSSRAGQR